MKLQFQVLLKGAEAREPGRVVEQNAQREPGSALIASEVCVGLNISGRLAKILLDWFVKVQRAALNQTHDDGGKGRLSQGSRGHHRIRS